MGHLSAGQAELVALIDEQTGLLSDLTTRLLTTARLDAGEVTIDAKPVGVGSLIEEVVDSLRDRLASMKVAIDLPDDNLVLCCDRQLMVMLLTQYIDNACNTRSSARRSPFAWCMQTRRLSSQWHSYGTVIPMADRERIFDRLLSIFDLLEPGFRHRNRTFGGQARGADSWRLCWVTSDEIEGTTFFAAIPAPVLKRST